MRFHQRRPRGPRIGFKRLSPLQKPASNKQSLAAGSTAVVALKFRCDRNDLFVETGL
jgi:hypothetical protein